MVSFWIATSSLCGATPRKDGRIVRAVFLLLLALSAGLTYAQEAMTLTVTPPLIQINLQPGETWTSGIQVVNGNPYDLTVYAEPVLFEPAGEDGRPRFKTPPGVGGESTMPDPTTLAGWLTLPRDGLSIPREQTITIPLSIHVPTDAAPGGHYAAVLIGNRAPEGARDESSVSVTSSIASLIFLRVAGTVVEDGRIRDFSTEKMLYETPEAQLSLRFENQGNVHLQPRGDITIYNMFGKKRGFIPINQTGEYGNVMPGSIRKFTYNWKADAGLWDIGRYRAEATLGYGADSKSFAQASAIFYILPVLPLVEVLGGGIALVLFVGWALKTYIRRAISIETRHSEATVAPIIDEVAPALRSMPVEVQKPKLTLTTLIKPLQAGIVDLRSVAGNSELKQQTRPVAEHEYLQSRERLALRTFLYQYRYFFAFILVIAVGWVVASALISDVLTYERPYEVHSVQEDGTAPVR